MKKTLLFTFATLLLAACSPWSSSNPPASVNIQTSPPLIREVRNTEIVELNDGDRYELIAQSVTKKLNGNDLKMFGYNGSIPGPTIKVQQGSTIRLNFVNQTDVATSIHSHGVRLKNAFDGSDLVQEPVKSGDSFEYEITFPDPGMYWYHPHFREDYLQEMGLYGNFWVIPSDPEYWSEVHREVPLVLDDILLTEGALAPFFTEAADHALMGRFGNTMLLNGETGYRLAVLKDEVIRFFVTNVANTRPFNVTIPGAKLKLVGGDNGRFERETVVNSVIIAPSERIILEAYFPDSGEYQIVNDTPVGKTVLGKITVGSETVVSSLASSFETLRTNSGLTEELKPYRALANREPYKVLNLDIDMMMNHSMGHGGMMGSDSDADGIEWQDDMGMMNQMMTSKNTTWKLTDSKTGKSNHEIGDWKFQIGEKVKIRIFNDPDSAHPMQHPIHIHGQRFLVTSRNGEAQENLVWKDTVLIRSGETVDLIVEMSNPGKWMIHCHIAEHLESGMMMKFEVY